MAFLEMTTVLNSALLEFLIIKFCSELSVPTKKKTHLMATVSAKSLFLSLFFFLFSNMGLADFQLLELPLSQLLPV